MKKYPKSFLIFISLSVLAALSIGVAKFISSGSDVIASGSAVRQQDLYGSWVEPVPGFKDQFQGFTLSPDGKAESINMATLLYTRWTFSDGRLRLDFKSVGNRVSSVGEEEFYLVGCSRKSLILKREDGGVVEMERRQ